MMEVLARLYRNYSRYPLADAGYGSFYNYLYCQEHGMGKYMKFTMYEKESRNEKYRNDPYRAVISVLMTRDIWSAPTGNGFFFSEHRR